MTDLRGGCDVNKSSQGLGDSPRLKQGFFGTTSTTISSTLWRLVLMRLLVGPFHSAGKQRESL